MDEVARRRLPADEAARWRRQLSERPTEARRLEEELALNRVLDQVLSSSPRTPVSSNFTARVLADIRACPDQESVFSRYRTRCVAWAGARFAFLARVLSGSLARIWSHSIPIAVAVVCVAIPLNWGWQRVQVHRHGAMARTAAELSVAAAMPGVAVLQDFEAVQLLETRSAPDDAALIQALREDAP
jgi:hypothetical protein